MVGFNFCPLHEVQCEILVLEIRIFSNLPSFKISSAMLGSLMVLKGLVKVD